MALKTDLSALAAGMAPDPDPIIATALADAWAKRFEAEDDKPMASAEARVRHSWASMCARRIGYEIAGAPVTEPLTVADHWRFGIGTTVHERWQDVIVEAFPDAEVEVKVTIPEIPSAGHVDLWLPATKTAVELKSINGFGFKMAIGARGAAEGPRTSALVQGALNAYALGAETLKIVYLSLENLSPRELEKVGVHEWQKFAAEWTFGKDVWLPLAQQEIARLSKILAVIDKGEMPPRAIPDLPKGARIVNPMKGAWTVETADGITETGSTWQCNYCPFQTHCANDS